MGLTMALKSFRKYLMLAFHHRLYLEKSNKNKLYEVLYDNYKLFRETHCSDVRGDTVILVIGFRLKVARSNRILHWLFQRICIITTPFWSGLDGFNTKLWMYSPTTHDYLGIYDWRGQKQASNYVTFLLPILKFFSVRNSVWYRCNTGKSLESFLHEHEVQSNFKLQIPQKV